MQHTKINMGRLKVSPWSLQAAIRAFGTTVLFGVSAAVAQSPPGAGSAGVSNRLGFTCGAGMSWSLGADGIARCKMNAVVPGITALSCPATSGYTTGAAPGCVFSLPAAQGGTTASVANTNTATHTGALTVDCNGSSGQWTSPVASCVESPRITSFDSSSSLVLAGSSVSLSWTTAAATAVSLNCLGANPYSGSGMSPNGGISLSTSTVGSTSCTLTATGPGGTSAPSSLTWGAREPYGCTALTITPGTCSYPIYALASGQQQTTSTTTANYSGSITSMCTDGSWSYSGATCSYSPPASDCAATTSYSGNCVFSIPSTSNGSGGWASNSAPGFTGSRYFSCSNGSFSYSSTSCDAAPAPSSGCAAVAAYVSSCIFVLPQSSHGETGSVASIASMPDGYSGSISYACNNGSFSQWAGSCWPNASPGPAPTPAPSNCSATTQYFGGCIFSIPWTSHGGSSSTSNIASDYSGSVSYSCSNGSFSYWGQSCSPSPAPTPAPTPAPISASCSGQYTSHGACSFYIPTTGHGGSGSASNSTSGYSGSISYSCSNGSFSYWGQSCSPSPAPTPAPTPAPAPSSCAGFSTSFGACSFYIPTTGHGGSGSASNSTPGYSGSISYSCSNGSFSYGDWSQSCQAPAPTPAPTQPPPINNAFAWQGTWWTENAWGQVNEAYLSGTPTGSCGAWGLQTGSNGTPLWLLPSAGTSCTTPGQVLMNEFCTNSPFLIVVQYRWCGPK